MSSVKAFPEGLKWVECERGVGGKNSPIRYIPEQDPVQDALTKDKKTTYFTLTLPNMGNELKVAVWASGTHEQFLLHVRSAIHVCKQMGLVTNFAQAERAVETAKLDAEIAKEEFTKLCNSKKKKKGNKGDAPARCRNGWSEALRAVRKSPLQQGSSAVGEDYQGPSDHTETPKKTWDSFHECVKFHLLQVFRHDAGKALKYYITNTLKKPNRVSIRQFFVRVEQLNSYLETLPCLYYSPKANQATKKVLPLDDADLATHLFHMCPAKWQTQYDLTENTTPVSTRALLLVLENIENNAELDNKPASMTKAKGAEQKRKMESMDSHIPKKPKRVGWTKKHCMLCKKHGGPHKSHNTRDCRRYNKDGTPIKKNGGAGKPNSKERKPEGANFTQITRAELKKALQKKSNKHKKPRANDSESDSDSDNSS
eukprot:CCRYP_006197-RA/>CCRYP_006197-RA protein AED:0.33 eAED:0.81 QI:0/0/0/1/1/1/2/0/425